MTDNSPPRPLLITDCDEVLMHMVVPFRAWLDEAHQIDFHLHGDSFSTALSRQACGTVLARDEVWPLLDSFFTEQMHRQYAVTGAFEALKRIETVADIVVLSNVGDAIHPHRTRQLIQQGLDCELVANRGDKGPALARIIAQRQPSVAVYVDDLAVHIDSAVYHVPDMWRLQLVAEPAIAGAIPPARGAHARIDDWTRAERWILDRFAEGPAPPVAQPQPQMTDDIP